MSAVAPAVLPEKLGLPDGELQPFPSPDRVTECIECGLTELSVR